MSLVEVKRSESNCFIKLIGVSFEKNCFQITSLGKT